MKNLKLIFGLLMVSAFVAITVLSYTTTDDTAIKKADIEVPRNG
jgi:predicted outer membrane lipoprotein